MSTANPHINYRSFQLLRFFIFFGEVFPGVPDLFNKELLLQFEILYSILLREYCNQKRFKRLLFLMLSLKFVRILKGERKTFSKNYKTYVFDKILHYTKKVLLKNGFFMLLANLIFVASHLKIHPAVHLNTSKSLTSL